MKPACAIACLLLTAGCSEELLPEGRLEPTPGFERDPFDESPAPTIARVTKTLADGTERVVLERGAAPASFPIAPGKLGTFTLEGLDDSGTRQAIGRSLPINPAGIAGLQLPLFVSRSGEFARPPGEFVHTHARPVAAIADDRFVVVASEGKGSITLDLYDLGVWAPAESPDATRCPKAVCTPRSMAIVDQALAVFVGDDWAVFHNFVTGSQGTLPTPKGIMSYAEVSGGSTHRAADGTAYILGAARNAGDPTRGALRIAGDGAVTAVTTTTARTGAAAASVEGRGIVVVGGSDMGSAVELLADGNDAFVALPFAPDSTTGAAALGDEATVLRLGGRSTGGAWAPTVRFDLGCGADCVPLPAGVGVELDTASAMRIDGRVVVFGLNQAGEQEAVVWDESAVSTISVNQPRRGAPLLLPTGHGAVLGGETNPKTLELLAF